MLTALANYLKSWTPLSVVILIVTCLAVFLIIWDTVHGIAIPVFLWGVITFITGGAGGASIAGASAEKAASSTASAITQIQNGTPK